MNAFIYACMHNLKLEKKLLKICFCLLFCLLFSESAVLPPALSAFVFAEVIVLVRRLLMAREICSMVELLTLALFTSSSSVVSFIRPQDLDFGSLNECLRCPVEPKIWVVFVVFFRLNKFE